MSKYHDIKNSAVDILQKIKSLEKFEDEDTYTFVRAAYPNYSGQKTVNFSTWKILLDRSKTKLCCRDAQGFKIIKVGMHDQTIDAPLGTRNLILAKSKADREIAITILDQLAEEKYGKI